MILSTKIILLRTAFNYSILSDIIKFCPQIISVHKSDFHQNRIHFCLINFISVDNSHFCPQFFSGQNSFLSDNFHFCQDTLV